MATNSNIDLHPVDRQILEVLQEQGRITNVQLAEMVGLSPPAVLERVRKLEERKIIARYVALVDNKKVGRGTIAFVSVSLNLHQKDAMENFNEFVNGCESVRECYHMAGGEDYLLKIYSRDIDDYEDFLVNSLTRTKGIDKIRTMFVLSTLKRETSVPIDAASGYEEERSNVNRQSRKNGTNGISAKGGENGQ